MYDHDHVFCLRCNRKLTDQVSAESAEQKFLNYQMTIDELV